MILLQLIIYCYKKKIKNGISDLSSKEFEMYISDSKNGLSYFDNDMEKVWEKRQKGWKKNYGKEYFSAISLEESNSKNNNIFINKYKRNSYLSNKTFRKRQKQNLLNLNIYMENRNDKLIIGNMNNYNRKHKKIYFYYNNKNKITNNN